MSTLVVNQINTQAANSSANVTTPVIYTPLVTTLDGVTDITMKTGNTSAGQIVVKSNSQNINITGAINTSKGATVTSASTTDIWSIGDGNFIHVNGTTNVNSFGTAPQAGAERWIVADTSFRIVNNANNNVQGAADYVTTSGDRIQVLADSTTVNYVNIFKATGQPTATDSAIVLLNTLTASSSANLQDTTSFTSAFRYYDIVIENLIPATNAQPLLLQPQVSATFQTGALSIAVTATTTTLGNAGLSQGFSSATGQISSSVSNTAGTGFCGTIRLYNPASTTSYKSFDYQGSAIATAIASFETIKGVVTYAGSLAAVTGFLLKFTSGNIASGSVKIYGFN